MTRENNQAAMWKALFEEHHSQLTEIAEILSHRGGSPEQILQAALAELEHRPLNEPFGQISAFRAVVKAAIAHSYTGIDKWIVTTSSGPFTHEPSGSQLFGDLPWAERAAYFLRDVLQYSKRDSALLLGISDANVDELHRFAKKRLGVPDELHHQSHTRHLSPTLAARSEHSMAFASYEEFRWP